MDNMETVAQPEVTAAPTAQPEAAMQVETTEPVAPAVDQPKLKVKYNKEEKELSLDEARDYAEKGMNYDKVKGRLDELENKWQEYEATAQTLGAPIDKIFKSLKDSHYAKLDKERAEREGISEEQARAKRLLEDRAKQAETEAQTYKQKLSEKEQQDQLYEYKRNEWQEFRAKHPEVTALPDEVNKKWEIMPLEVAYGDWYEKQELSRRLKEMEEKQGIVSTNQENSEASTGALGAGAVPEKPLTLKDVENMTPAQKEKNHDRIMREVYGFNI